MYWQSLWLRSPAADPSARGIFYLAAIATKKVTTLQVNKPLSIAAAPKAERERVMAQAVLAAMLRIRPTRRANSAHPARDRQASDIILIIGHNSSLASSDARRWTRVLGSY